MEFYRILVPINGTGADDEAIRLACQLARKAKGKIWVVHVFTVRRTLPLDVEVEPEIRKAEQILEHAGAVAKEGHCEVEPDLLQAREVGHAIVDEAIEREADLIVMGIEYKTRFGQFSLGDVVPYVLKSAPCRVMLYQLGGTAAS